MNSQTLLSALLADEQKHISLLQRFVQAPSPAPPGDTRAAAAVIREYLVSEHGIPVDVIAPKEHMPNLVAEFTCGGGGGDDDDNNNKPSGYSKRGSRLVMNGHMDVFPVGDDNGADWDRDPWSGALVEGRIHGRGTVDMKAGTIASVVAFAYLYRFREFLPGRDERGRRSVALCCVSDEETGGKYGTRWLLDHGRDGVEELQLFEEAEEEEEEEGEGEYGNNGKKEKNKSPWLGDVMINAEPGAPSTIRFAEKGTLRLNFIVDVGPGAHGAFTHLSASATRIAARVICDLAAVEEIEPDLDPKLKEYLQRADVRRAIDECMGPGAADIATKCTLNIGTIHGGLKVNMIPGRCVFEADIRMPLGLEADEVMEVVHGVLAMSEYSNYVKVEIQKAASNPASASEHDHPMVEILARQAERVSREKKKRPLAIPSLGATDCKFYRYKGTPAYVFGVSPDGMGAKNESVSVKEFLDVLRTHALAGWEYLGGQV